ncbi:MAG TPA: hypothetical protein PLS46_14175 [Microthrixaceae bacterium]|nr:hypothetical protein [Microthrixaceae bacterium]
MAFGQSSGPPASMKQIEFLESLLQEHDYGTFREARHRLGLTQRQAQGKFSIGEASALIERLQSGDLGEGGADGQLVLESSIVADRAEQKLQRQREELIAGVPAEMLAHELERRGWCCIAPTE